jgi:LCP family protein required for cell wall assembly
MGSDSRDCKGCHIDKESGGGSDTTILLHLSGDRKHAYGVSIPRDTMIDRPACKTADGKTIPAESYAQWNAGFSLAGPGCTIEQVETISKIPIDDSVVVNFEGFKDMVDAVGGVQVCIPQEIDDREHGIVLKAGTRTIDGNEALSYVRVRHGVGDGSDLSRIKRQQAFIASLVKAVFSARTLSSPVKVYSFLKAATKNLEFDDKVASLSSLASLGSGFKSIGLDDIKFFTIPIEADPQDPAARVILAPTANAVWKHLRKDEVLPKSLTSGAIRAGAVPGQIKKHPGKQTQAQDPEFESAGLCTS